MTATELIDRLNSLVAEFGDHPVYYYDFDEPWPNELQVAKGVQFGDKGRGRTDIYVLGKWEAERPYRGRKGNRKLPKSRLCACLVCEADTEARRCLICKSPLDLSVLAAIQFFLESPHLGDTLELYNRKVVMRNYRGPGGQLTTAIETAGGAKDA